MVGQPRISSFQIYVAMGNIIPILSFFDFGSKTIKFFIVLINSTTAFFRNFLCIFLTKICSNILDWIKKVSIFAAAFLMEHYVPV